MPKIDSKISSFKLSALESILKGSGSFPLDDAMLRQFRAEYQGHLAETSGTGGSDLTPCLAPVGGGLRPKRSEPGNPENVDL